MYGRAEPVSERDLARMRALVAAAMRGERATEAPPAELVRRGHLGPLAYKMGLAEHRAEYAASAIMAERRAALLREVLAAMRECGVRVARIKGIALAGTLYPDPAERPMQDVDLLVWRPHISRAMRCMTSLGFEPVGSARRLSGYYHALTYTRDGMMIDLHRDIVQHGRSGLWVGDLWWRAQPAAGADLVERLDPVDQLLLCALHAARHELLVPALSYVDLARLCRQVGDRGRAELLERARMYRLSSAVAAVLAVTDELAAAARPVPPGRRRWRQRLLPGSDEILSQREPGRPLQLARKVALADAPADVVGLAAAYGRSALQGWLRSRAR